MAILNKFFCSTESVAKEIVADDEDIIKHWKAYLDTIPAKKDIIGKLPDNVDELKELLKLELVDISGEEKDEAELISDLEVIKHSQKIEKIQRLEQCLGYAETKYKHVFGLLENLHSILSSQMHLVEKLAASENIEELISHIKAQLELELEVIAQIKQIKTFHDLFLALVKGEHIIKTMDAKEDKLLKKMQEGMGKIFSSEINEGVTYGWAMTVFEAIEDKVHEGIADGMFPGYHPDVEFEFVNRLEFVVLVRETAQNLRKLKTSEEMIKVFVHIFREWFNNR